MKRLLAEGMEKDIRPRTMLSQQRTVGRDARSGILMLEWYRKGATLSDLMDDTEDMVMSVAREFRISPLVANKKLAPYHSRTGVSRIFERGADTSF